MNRVTIPSEDHGGAFNRHSEFQLTWTASGDFLNDSFYVIDKAQHISFRECEPLSVVKRVVPRPSDIISVHNPVSMCNEMPLLHQNLEFLVFVRRKSLIVALYTD